MPTLFRFQGVRVVIYPNDHRPAHVHVLADAGEAVFILNCPRGPLELRENLAFEPADLRRIAIALSSRLGESCLHWSLIHGTD